MNAAAIPAVPVEVRVATQEHLQWALAADSDIIGIGDEGCVHRLPGGEELDTMLSAILAGKKACRLITPFASQHGIGRIVDTIHRAAAKPLLPAVINSHGVLWRVTGLGVLVRGTLGMLVSRRLVALIIWPGTSPTRRRSRQRWKRWAGALWPLAGTFPSSTSSR